MWDEQQVFIPSLVITETHLLYYFASTNYHALILNTVAVFILSTFFM